MPIVFAHRRPSRGAVVLRAAPFADCRWARGDALVGAARRRRRHFRGRRRESLLFVDKVSAGALAGLTITANILMSLCIDHFGLFGVQQHALGPGRAIGAALMVAGIYAISKF